MNQVKKREEIDAVYKINFDQMYQNDSLFYEDVEKFEQSVYKFQEQYENKMLESASQLLLALNEYYAINALVEKIFVYAYTKITTDGEDLENKKLYAKAEEVLEKLNVYTAFVSPEILASTYEQIEEFYKEEPKLKTYDFNFKQLFRGKEHILDKKNEQLFTKFSSICSNFRNSSENIRVQLMNFGTVKDENNEEIKITPQNYSILMRGRNRRIRQTAYENARSEYKKYNDVLGYNYIGNIKYRTLEARERGYQSVLEEDLTSLNIPISVFHTLVETANRNLDIYQKEFKIRKDILKLDSLEPYDLSAPLLDQETEYPYEEAKELILDVFKIYGEEYCNILKRIFDNHWIDVYSNENKDTGWYKNQAYLSHVVVFCNYFSKYFDVSCLAHELGHAVHGTLAQENNPFHLYEDSLFIAEVASLTNEMVLGKILLSRPIEKQMKLEILDHIISTFSANFFDSVKGSEFEYQAHQLAENGENITADKLNKLWTDISKKYTAGVLENVNEYGWSRVPHFFTDFYYYKYATGVAMAMVLSDQIINGKEEDKQNYLNFLKSGGSLEPMDALQKVGIDVTSASLYEKAIESYDHLLDQFSEIYNS